MIKIAKINSFISFVMFVSCDCESHLNWSSKHNNFFKNILWIFIAKRSSSFSFRGCAFRMFSTTKMNFAFCLISLFISSAFCSDCKVITNEINTIDPKKPETMELIEPKSTCDQSIPLRGYKLIGFEYYESTGRIVLVVNLW